MSRTGLVRPREGRLLAGVCAGMARSLGWNANLMRLLYIVVSLVSAAFPGILFYILLWFVIPSE